MVQVPAALRVEVPERGIARGRDILVQLLVDGVEVDDELRVRVLRAVHVEKVLGAFRLRLEQIVEREPELLSQLAHGRVALVDELASVLRDLAIGELH